MKFSQRYRFSEWPNKSVPAIAAGVYAIWQGSILIYCRMAGREIEKAQAGNKKKYGLIIRLASHASGRLSGDQFCIYVANRFVIPSLKHEQLVKFTHGEHTLDQLTKMYIHNNFEYEFIVVNTSKEVYQLETKARSGLVFDTKPLLNPVQNAN